MGIEWIGSEGNRFLEHFKLTASTPGGTAGIHLHGMNASTIRNVTITGSWATAGIFAEARPEPPPPAKRQQLNNNICNSIITSDISGLPGDGIRVSGQQTAGLYIFGCKIQGNSGWGINHSDTNVPDAGSHWLELHVDRCELEGNLQGAVTGYLWNSSITGCHFENPSVPQQHAYIHIGSGQSFRGLLIAQNYFGNTVPGNRTDSKAYCIYLAPDGDNGGLSIINNVFNQGTLAAIYSNAVIGNGTIQDNFRSPTLPLLDAAAGSPLININDQVLPLQGQMIPLDQRVLLGLFGAPPVTRPTIDGSKAGNTAVVLALLKALSDLGLVKDITTP